MRIKHLIIVVSMSIAGILLGNSLLIHSKALLAQLLISQAWQAVQKGEDKTKPWPWADTWPVARLSSPRHGQDLYVLDGANGSSFAFGPARYRGLDSTIIAGHRDTHFRFLKDIKRGDELVLEDQLGKKTHYEVSSSRVVDRFRESLRPPFNSDSLMLVTCYPFDALNPGGHLRFVVTADPMAHAS